MLSIAGLYGFSTLDETNQEKVQDTIGGVAGSMASVVNKTVAEKWDDILLSREYEKLGKIVKIETTEYTTQTDCKSNEECNENIPSCENLCFCDGGWCWKEKV